MTLLREKKLKAPLSRCLRERTLRVGQGFFCNFWGLKLIKLKLKLVFLWNRVISLASLSAGGSLWGGEKVPRWIFLCLFGGPGGAGQCWALCIFILRLGVSESAPPTTHPPLPSDSPRRCSLSSPAWMGVSNLR